jgi:ribosomal protein L37AE/L43A
MPTKTCQSCQKFPAVKKVLTDNKRSRIWKCNKCIQRNNVPGIGKVKINAA